MKTKRLMAMFMAVFLVVTMGTTVWAAKSTTATVPVTLTVSNEYRAVNVTVPASFPVEVINGVVVTADNAKIINNAKNGAVKITAVSVTDGAYRVGNYDNFSGSQTIALKFNGCPTTGAGKLNINDQAFPAIRAGGSLPLTYFAKVSGDAQNTDGVEVAKIVFTISIVE
ncbi:MAG: hypothetical protein IJX14_11835 [Clostridia bacterium]|nr:hypothetical protein [Clostridia bacterium]